MNETERVRSEVVRGILSGEFSPGGKITTERKMAARMGVSRVTVRRAYDQLVESSVIRRVHGSGTIVNDAPRGGTGPMAAVALLASLRDEFCLRFIDALEREVSLNDSMFVLKLTDQAPDEEERAAFDIVSRGIRHMIVWGSGASMYSNTFERIRALGVNMVFFDRVIPDGYADYVGLDNEHAVSLIMRHVMRSGKKNCLMVTYSDLKADSNALREKAIARFCDRHSLKLQCLKVPWERTAREEYLRKSRRRLSSVVGSSGVVCVNDYAAESIREVFPRCRHLYGIDGLPGIIERGIVSVKQPMPQMASEVLACLRNQQKKGTAWKPEQRFVKGVLVLSKFYEKL